MATLIQTSAAPIGLTPDDHLALMRAPRLRPEQQWWNLPAKIDTGKQIAADELARSVGHHNDLGDALRHARWSQRMAEDLGPVFSTLAGVEHEIDGSLHGQPVSEAVMDLHNNGVGIRAAGQGQPIDPSQLQGAPIGPMQAISEGYSPSR